MKIPFPKYEKEVVEEIEAYLDMHYQTEIEFIEEYDNGLATLRARGYLARGHDDRATRNPHNHARPMFQVIQDGAFSGGRPVVSPCMACDRFDRSWSCPEHPEIPWDRKARRWVGLDGPTPESVGFMMPGDLIAEYARQLGLNPTPGQIRTSGLPDFSMRLEGGWDGS